MSDDNVERAPLEEGLWSVAQDRLQLDLTDTGSEELRSLIHSGVERLIDESSGRSTEEILQAGVAASTSLSAIVQAIDEEGSAKHVRAADERLVADAYSRLEEGVASIWPFT